MRVQEAMLARMLRQRDFGKIDRGWGGAVIAVFYELFGDFDADVLLGFLGAATDVGSEDYVFHASQGRDDLVPIGLRLDGKNVDGGAGNMFRLERGGESIDIDYVATGGVDQLGAFFHAG